MIYAPELDETIKIIQGEIQHLSAKYDSGSAMRELRAIGKPAVHYVLRAIEQPFEDPRYDQIRINCMTLLKWFAQDNAMTMSELQRYRQIIISEKQ